MGDQPASRRPRLLIPVQASRDSKSRLSSVLRPEQRQDLVLCLLRDFLSHCLKLDGRLNYGVVSSDQDVAQITRDFGGFVLSEPSEAETLGEIVDRSYRQSDVYDPEAGLLIMPVDLPLVTHEALSDLLDQVTRQSVFLVPDRDEEGTNVLWRHPADVIDCQYEGTSSFVDHVSVADEAGIKDKVEHLKPFQFDLDTPDDWYRLLQAPERLSEHTQSFVEEFMLKISSTVDRS